MPGIVETPQDFAVGCSVRLRLDDKSDEVSGQIFAVDSARGMLLLQHPAERHNTFDFTLINTDHVLEVVEAVPPERRASSAEEPLPEIDPARTKDRFQRSFRAAQLAAEKIGIGVSRRGQAIFDAISKTLPCHWDGKSILVLDEVAVEEPYLVDSLKLLHGSDTRLLDRVKLVIASEDGGSER